VAPSAIRIPISLVRSVTHQHDVHDANAAHDQGNAGHPGQEEGEHPETDCAVLRIWEGL